MLDRALASNMQRHGFSERRMDFLVAIKVSRIHASVALPVTQGDDMRFGVEVSTRPLLDKRSVVQHSDAPSRARFERAVSRI